MIDLIIDVLDPSNVYFVDVANSPEQLKFLTYGGLAVILVFIVAFILFLSAVFKRTFR